MTTSSFEAFREQAMAEGFDEVIVKEWAPQLCLETHTHPFDVRACVVQGEYWLTTAQGVRHLKSGDTFRLARHVPHSELYGPDGGTVWIARAN